MAKLTATTLIILFWIVMLFKFSSAAYDVTRYGAKPDGVTDSTPAFLKAWQAACSSTTAATINVPKGRYLLKAVTFRGPCKNSIKIQIAGTIVAPTDYRALGNSGYWILFIKVDKVSVIGGSLDGRAAGFWACRKSGKSCPVGARVCYLIFLLLI